jgi:CRP-like cAMP-binding protein
MQPLHVPAGATIFRTGDPSTAVYVIEDGEVAITVNGGIEVARLQPGELFG